MRGLTRCHVQIDFPVSVIAVVGLYRTGKSFLMNRILLEQSDGFTVGPTVNPCTKGLWLWNEVMTGQDKDGNTVKYLIVDTEGIGALDTNSQHDSIIFSLALLLSSNFIYNSVGSIDEGALNNLSLVVNLTKHIHVRSSNSGSAEDDGADFAQYFPSFLWLVRDFTLQLVNSDGQAFSSKEYLERALQPVPGFTEQIEAKNRLVRPSCLSVKSKEDIRSMPGQLDHAVTFWSHELKMCERPHFPVTPLKRGTPLFAKNTSFTNDITDSRVRHSEAQESVNE